jgi:hypothetical protein
VWARSGRPNEALEHCPPSWLFLACGTVAGYDALSVRRLRSTRWGGKSRGCTSALREGSGRQRSMNKLDRRRLRQWRSPRGPRSEEGGGCQAEPQEGDRSHRSRPTGISRGCLGCCIHSFSPPSLTPLNESIGAHWMLLSAGRAVKGRPGPAPATRARKNPCCLLRFRLGQHYRLVGRFTLRCWRPTPRAAVPVCAFPGGAPLCHFAAVANWLRLAQLFFPW